MSLPVFLVLAQPRGMDPMDESAARGAVRSLEECRRQVEYSQDGSGSVTRVRTLLDTATNTHSLQQLLPRTTHPRCKSPIGNVGDLG